MWHHVVGNASTQKFLRSLFDLKYQGLFCFDFSVSYFFLVAHMFRPWYYQYLPSQQHFNSTPFCIYDYLLFLNTLLNFGDMYFSIPLGVRISVLNFPPSFKTTSKISKFLYMFEWVYIVWFGISLKERVF